MQPLIPQTRNESVIGVRPQKRSHLARANLLNHCVGPSIGIREARQLEEGLSVSEVHAALIILKVKNLKSQGLSECGFMMCCLALGYVA